MDPQPAGSPNSEVPESKGAPRIILYILIIVAVLLVGVVFYFLSRQTTKLPATPQQAEKTKEFVFARQLLSPASTEAIASQSSSLICPTLRSFCQNSNSFKEGSFSAQLKSGALVYASFDGTINSLPAAHPTSEGEEKYNLIILTNNKLGLQAMYSLKGTVTAKTDVLAGEAIATSSGQPISFMENKPFVFTLIDANVKGGQTRLLKAADFN